MNVNHRQGLTQVDILPECPRRPVEAKLQQHARDYGWNVLKGLLMYLVSLGLAIKVLLYARGYTSNVEIWSECLSIVLLIIASTLRRSKQEAFECGVWDKEEPGCFMGAQTVYVKRDGEEIKIQSDNLQVGDILLCKTVGEAVHVDGLVITASGLVVNEEATVSGLANVSKDEVWLADPYALLKTNCFVLSGSVIRKGRAEILVCLTGRNTSYARRYDHRKANCTASDISRLSFQVALIYKLAMGLLAGSCAVYSWQWIALEEECWSAVLQFLYRCCTAIAYWYIVANQTWVDCARSYLAESISSARYSLNKCETVVQLNDCDLLVCEIEVLSRVCLRGCIRKCDHVLQFTQLATLSVLHERIGVKLLTKYIDGDLWYQLNDEVIDDRRVGEEDEEKKLRKLMSSVVVMEEEGQSRYALMRLLLELGYRVGYVFVDGCGDNEGEEIGIVQVGVLEMREHRRWQLESSELTELRQQVETVQYYQQSPIYSGEYHLVTSSWVRLRSGSDPYGSLLQLFYTSLFYNKVSLAYTFLILNSLCEFLILYMLIYQSITIILPLNLNLILMIITRSQQLSLYHRSLSTGMAKHGLSDVIKLNIFLLLCYAFLLVQLIDHPHVEFRLFLMLLINKIVRVEGMLINGGWREVFRKGWKVVGVWFVMLAMANWVEDRGVDRCIQEFADVGLVWGLYGCFVGFCDEKKGKDMNY